MIRSAILCIALIVSGVNAQAQLRSDSIKVKRSISRIYMQDGEALSNRQLMLITRSNMAAYKVMRVAKISHDFSKITGYSGAILAGFPLIWAAGGGDVHWPVLLTGTALLGASAYLSISSSVNKKRAVGIYNSGINPLTRNDLQLDIGLVSQGIGIRVCF